MRGGDFDVLVVGGGINGAVAAAVLAARGASVALVERGDFAGFTSQASSNLVWGGFKYLENYELLLVRKLCMSRNRLIAAYPDNIKPLGFLAALDKSSPYPPWLAALGSAAYWGIGNFRTPKPRKLSRKQIAAEEPIINTDAVQGGIEYFDAYLRDNDARFVFGFVLRAMQLGAAAANYLELATATHDGDGWTATLRDLEAGSNAQGEGETFQCRARYVVNAAGPYVDGLNEAWGLRTDHRIVYSKGIHLVVPQLTPNERVLAFFDDTQRLFYVIPMGRRSVIGTTDTRVKKPETVVDDEDREFLLAQISSRLNLDKPLDKSDIIAERSGVRPLVVTNDGDDKSDVDWTTLSRKHEIEVDEERGVVTIFGGKLTDCLNVGEEVAAAMEDIGLSLQPDEQQWYGEPNAERRGAFFARAAEIELDGFRDRAGLEPLTERLWRRYGERAFAIVDDIANNPELGQDMLEGADYLRAEIAEAARSEMVTKLVDFLRRRSKIALVIREQDVRSAAGLEKMCEMLFGEQAQAKLAEHYGQWPAAESPTA